MSLPSWERGLKLLKGGTDQRAILSLPSWERGLKYNNNGKRITEKDVAPLVGAWIEIYPDRLHTGLIMSLPSWERGLKSQHIYQNLHPRGSLPSWERGLKLFDLYMRDKSNIVAPLVGAWIEIG